MLKIQHYIRSLSDPIHVPVDASSVLSCFQRLWSKAQPAPEWGPAINRHRELYVNSLREYNPKGFYIQGKLYEEEEEEMKNLKV